MKDKEYIENVLKTESVDFEAIKERLSDERTIRGLHAALGVVTEAGELADVFKKHLFYGKPIDWVNLEEETGDLLWYVGVLTDVLKTHLGAIKTKNIDKLAKRYPDQIFTSDSAINRDTDAEREILEVTPLPESLKAKDPFDIVRNILNSELDLATELQKLMN